MSLLLLLLPLLSSFLCFFSGTTAQSSISELQILLDFKRSLGSDGFFDSWNPTSDSPCRFSGVACDVDGYVTEIDITNRGISGENLRFQLTCQLPRLAKFAAGSNHLEGVLTAVGTEACANLQYLDLASNFFTGQIPDLSALSSLRVLNLTANGFTGPFPAYFLGKLTNLISLSLGDNPFDRSPFPVAVTTLTDLTWLYLSNCSISGAIPPEIRNLKNLRNLELSHNDINGGFPSAITELTNLWQLEIYENSITGRIPAGFGNLKNLAYFDASNNRLEGNLSEIRFLRNLISLQLFNNTFSGEVPVEFGDFRNLVNLSLYSNQLTGELPQQLGSWAEFIFIDVSTNLLTGRIPPDMCKRGTMKKLLMLENKFTGEIPATYGNCSTLLRFRVSDNLLSGVVPDGIWSLSNVNILDLAFNDFSGKIGVGIGKAKKLTQLVINGNQFSGSFPKEISGATELVTIDASSNRISGNIHASFGELKKLNSLILSRNEFSGDIPASIGSCLSLNKLNLALNFLSGVIPASLGDLQVLNSLNLSSNHLTGMIPDTLSSLKLSDLDLSDNQLSGKVPSALATSSYGRSFIGNPALCSDNVEILRSCSSESRTSSQRFRIILSSFLVLAAIALASVSFFHFFKNRRGIPPSKRFTSKESWNLKSFRVLTFDEQEILNGITPENLIGKGGSGKVYKVDLSGGNTVAVKHIWNYFDFSSSNAGGGKKECREAMLTRRGSIVSREFEAEVGTLSSIRHVNVVQLYCSITGEDSSLLVYEYLPNGSLWDHLHGVGKAVDWHTRYEVAVGAAKGLEYLHLGCERPILHRDVKSSNILLDEFLKPRIADFGLARILHDAAAAGKDESSRVIAGTCGYIAPEYAYACKVSEKSDVYSFGVVLLELVTGKKPIEPEFGDNQDIVHWVSSKIGGCRQEVTYLLDSTIPTEMREEAMKVLKVGVLCTIGLPSVRPSMRTVVQMLEDAGRWRCPVVEVDEKDEIDSGFGPLVRNRIL